jgi:hypothetical protein
LVFSDQDAQGIIESGPQMVLFPAPEDTMDSLPGREASGQIPPRDAAFDNIEDRVERLAQIRGRTAPAGGFGQHGSEIFPLGIAETRSVFGVFHRLNGSFRLKMADKSQRKSQ